MGKLIKIKANNSTRAWLTIAFFNLVTVAVVGLLLRTFRFAFIPSINYGYLLHAHSHFAFGGWGFLALFIAFHHAFIPEQAKQKRKAYRMIFWMVLLSCWGMLFSFPFQGYAAVSITFSSVYILLTFWFAYLFYLDTRRKGITPLSIKFARGGLLFLVLSAAGAFAMAPFMAMGMSKSDLATNAIYFYLHFQYNGWFILGIIALFFKWLEDHQVLYPRKYGLRFFRLTFWSCIPAYFISVLWSTSLSGFYSVAMLAGFLQLYALFPLSRVLLEIKKNNSYHLTPVARKASTLVLCLFVVKTIFQLWGTTHFFVDWTVLSRDLVIGFLHMILLGIVSIALFSYFIQERLLIYDKHCRLGLGLFLWGFGITELFLFVTAVLELLKIGFPSFNLWMLIFTVFLPVGIFLMFRTQYKSLAFPPDSQDRLMSSMIVKQVGKESKLEIPLLKKDSQDH